MFLNRQGNFDDVTLVSGIDFLQDGRGFAVGDFDNDGIVELGIISNQQPRFRIVHLHPEDPAQKSRQAKSFVSIRLVGGNQQAGSNENLSPRDPVGAILHVKTGKTTRTFQLSRGEGFSSQNSQAVHIGLGDNSKVDQLKIRWPSGRITVETDILAGSRLQIFEVEN